MKVLNWNARGLNAPSKRRILRDLILEHHIDIIAIQETKKETFTNRALRSISTRFDKWIWVASQGRSGGILFGCDSNTCTVLDSIVHRFSVDIFIQNRSDRCTWMLTIVYAPVDRQLKPSFWRELKHNRIGRQEPWVICGDFNAIRARHEKSGSNFDVRLSGKFNTFVSNHHLVELKLHQKQFTWASGRNRALLDRFFVSLDWIDQHSNVTLQHLSSYGSDHVPLILSTGQHTDAPPPFRFDPEWLANEEFPLS